MYKIDYAQWNVNFCVFGPGLENGAFVHDGIDLFAPSHPLFVELS